MSQTHTLESAFEIERMPFQIWQSLGLPEQPGEVFDLPDMLGALGARERTRAELLLHAPRRLCLRLLDPPFAHGELEVDLAPANASGWPTHVAIRLGNVRAVDGESPAQLDARWRHTVSDIELQFMHAVILGPVTIPVIPGFGLVRVGAGLTVTCVSTSHIADEFGIQRGDLLVEVEGVRILDLSSLTAVLTALRDRPQIEFAWIRSAELMRRTGANPVDR